MAARLLTMNLLAPMTDQSAIQSRLDAITEIVGEEERSYALRESMAPLGNSKVDLDRLINQLLAPEPRFGAGEPSRTENKIGQLLSLDSTLRSLGPVRAALTGARSGLLRAIRAFISGNSQLDEIMELCADSINPDLFLAGGSKSLSSRNARLYAIKAAHSPLLDVARETYKEVRWTGVALSCFADCASEYGRHPRPGAQVLGKLQAGSEPQVGGDWLLRA